MWCRICGSTKNLKYTPAEIRGSQNLKKRLPLPLKEIANAINGNICKFCDIRLENFHNEAPPAVINITDDDRICEMFCKRQYAYNEAATTVRSLGSDGDPEVIEVLTSRETTPDKAVPETKHGGRLILNSNPRIVDVIDLEDDDESIDKVINTTINNPSCHTRQENLLGCLNLVTSDSESSEIHFEPCHNTIVKREEIPSKIVNKSIKGESDTSENAFPVCNVCGIRFLDTASLNVHMKDNHQLLCPVCELHFKTDLELLYHIRQKHRQYNGEKLSQGAPSPKDSAMTIRLRFQNSTFYECQLCGHIDSQFKEHKEHIIQNHPHESKSLRDPIMKTKFSCPACHQKIGSHHVDVCRHVLLKHPEKYKKYIKEVTDLSTLPVKTSKSLQNIKQSARVLAFIDKGDYFYECQLCKKIFGNLQCFLKHLNAHNIDEWTEYEKRKSGTKVVSNDSSIRSRRKTDEHKISNMKEKRASLPKNKTDFESNQKSKQKTTKKPIPSKEAIKSKKNGVFKKPLKQAITNLAATEATTTDSKRQKKLKRRSKNDASTGKGGTTKVKVKTPLRHFPTQKYDCKHCQSTFKGFRKLHMHLILTHSADEFRSCTHCPHLFTAEAALSNHVHCLHTDSSMAKRKRKLTSHSTENETFDENFNKEHSKKRPRLIQVKANSPNLQNQNIEIQKEPDAWLKELYQLSWEKNSKLCNLNSNTEVHFFKGQLFRTAHNVCRYCARLFAESVELSAHEKLHIDAADMPWIALTQ